MVYLGRTTRQLYRFTPAFNSEGQMLSSVLIGGTQVAFLDADGNILPRISINGEQATFCQGARDGSVPRGTIGGGFTGQPTGQNQGPVMSPTWAQSDWELPG